MNKSTRGLPTTNTKTPMPKVKSPKENSEYKELRSARGKVMSLENQLKCAWKANGRLMTEVDILEHELSIAEKDLEIIRNMLIQGDEI